MIDEKVKVEYNVACTCDHFSQPKDKIVLLGRCIRSPFVSWRLQSVSSCSHDGVTHSFSLSHSAPHLNLLCCALLHLSPRVSLVLPRCVPFVHWAAFAEGTYWLAVFGKSFVLILWWGGLHLAALYFDSSEIGMKESLHIRGLKCAACTQQPYKLHLCSIKHSMADMPLTEQLTSKCTACTWCMHFVLVAI